MVCMWPETQVIALIFYYQPESTVLCSVTDFKTSFINHLSQSFCNLCLSSPEGEGEENCKQKEAVCPVSTLTYELLLTHLHADSSLCDLVLRSASFYKILVLSLIMLTEPIHFWVFTVTVGKNAMSLITQHKQRFEV